MWSQIGPHRARSDTRQQCAELARRHRRRQPAMRYTVGDRCPRAFSAPWRRCGQALRPDHRRAARLQHFRAERPGARITLYPLAVHRRHGSKTRSRPSSNENPRPGQTGGRLNVKVRVKPDGSSVDLANVKMSMNPFDEIAVEEAVRLKEKASPAKSSRFPQDAACQRRHAPHWRWAPTARSGRDRRRAAALAVAKLLRALVAKEAPQLVILGKQAIDDDANQKADARGAARLGIDIRFKVDVAGDGVTSGARSTAAWNDCDGRGGHRADLRLNSRAMRPCPTS